MIRTVIFITLISREKCTGNEDDQSPADRIFIVRYHWKYYYQKIPVIRALFAIGTYFWLAVILFFYGIRRRRAEIWNSWLLVLALCLTVFLGPISLVRYYLLLFLCSSGRYLLISR